MIKASSKHCGLNQLTGMLWFTAGRTLQDYYCQYVASKLNLADAPSRGLFSDVKRLGAQIIQTIFSECIVAIENWMASMHVQALLE